MAKGPPLRLEEIIENHDRMEILARQQRFLLEHIRKRLGDDAEFADLVAWIDALLK